MLTLTLQWVNTIIMLVFALFATRIGLGSAATPTAREGWLISGLAFLLTGTVSVIQLIFGTWAFMEGEGSGVSSTYLRWAPVFNHGRLVSFIAFGLLLAWFALRAGDGSTDRVAWRGPLAVLMGGLVIGGSIGTMEGADVRIVHYTIVTILDSVEAVVLLVSVLLLLLRDRVDRLLWLALTTYSLSVVAAALWGPLLVDGAAKGIPVLPYWTYPLSRVPLWGAMVWLAFRRLRLARSGRLVPTMYGTLR